MFLKSFLSHMGKVWLFNMDFSYNLRILCDKFGHVFEEYVVTLSTQASFLTDG